MARPGHDAVRGSSQGQLPPVHHAKVRPKEHAVVAGHALEYDSNTLPATHAPLAKPSPHQPQPGRPEQLEHPATARQTSVVVNGTWRRESNQAYDF